MIDTKGAVFITGASSGFGAASARKYASHGHRLIIAARRKERIDALVDELSTEVPVHGMALDVRNRDAVLSLPDSLPEDFRDIGILVNNAGLARGLEGADEVDIDDWEVMVDTNVKGLMYMTRALLPGMAARGGGHVVNIGSVAASWPYPGGNAYGGTKAFVQQFSRNLRADLQGKNIRVSNVEPGMCETEFSLVRFEGDADKASQVYRGMTPLAAADIAEIVYWVTALPPHVNVNQLEVMPTEQAWSPFSVHRREP